MSKHLEGLAPDYRMALALERIAGVLERQEQREELREQDVPPATPEDERQRLYDLARHARRATSAPRNPKEDPKA